MGAETWIVPPLFLSQWAQKVNWLLNFQLSRAEKHVASDLPEKMEKILEDEEIEPFSLSHSRVERQSLLVINPNLLPNKFTVQVFDINNTAGQLDFSRWVSASLKICEKLKTSSVRIFAPKDLPASKLQALLEKHPFGAEIQVVYESSEIQ